MTIETLILWVASFTMFMSVMIFVRLGVIRSILEDNLSRSTSKIKEAPMTDANTAAGTGGVSL